MKPFHTAVLDEPAAASPLTVLVTSMLAPLISWILLGLKYCTPVPLSWVFRYSFSGNLIS